MQNHGVNLNLILQYSPLKSCLGYISETIRCRKNLPGRDIGWGCRCAMSRCNLELACRSDLDLLNLVQTMSQKLLSIISPAPLHNLNCLFLKVSYSLYCFTSLSQGPMLFPQAVDYGLLGCLFYSL